MIATKKIWTEDFQILQLKFLQNQKSSISSKVKQIHPQEAIRSNSETTIVVSIDNKAILFEAIFEVVHRIELPF